MDSLGGMSAELFLPLVGYFLLSVTGVLWIALDAETAYIFDVFGKNIDFMWRHSGQRWKFTFMYGWRLLALVLLIGVCIYLAWPLAFAVSNARGTAIIVLVGLALIPFSLLPWIYIANGIRFRRTLRNTARQLTPIVNELAAASDISTILDKADYRLDPPWSAWHPKDVDDWPQVVPVAYVRTEPTPTVVFPYDWETFLAWNLGDQLSNSGTNLPFNGPGETTFKLRCITPLVGVPEWSLVYAEMEIGDDSAMQGLLKKFLSNNK
jgi:hypothetical protein